MTNIELIPITITILAYLLGSIPFGIVISKILTGEDPRDIGSGNIGATNVMRASGKGAAIITLACDILKGAIPVYLALYFNLGTNAVCVVGAAAFLGHLFPIFLKFKGGKGVATAVGVLAATSPLVLLATVIVFIIIVGTTRYVSLGSILGSLLLPALFLFVPGASDYLPLGIVFTVLIVLKHSSNIKKLMAGTEDKLW